MVKRAFGTLSFVDLNLFDLLENMIKRAFILSILFFLFGTTIVYSQQNEWENPVKYEWNKEQPHTDFMIYDRSGDAIKDEYELSPWYKSLNGKWKFIY